MRTLEEFNTDKVRARFPNYMKPEHDVVDCSTYTARGAILLWLNEFDDPFVVAEEYRFPGTKAFRMGVYGFNDNLIAIKRKRIAKADRVLQKHWSQGRENTWWAEMEKYVQWSPGEYMPGEIKQESV